MQLFFLVYFDIRDIYDDPFGPKHVVNKFPTYLTNFFFVFDNVFSFIFTVRNLSIRKQTTLIFSNNSIH